MLWAVLPFLAPVMTKGQIEAIRSDYDDDLRHWRQVAALNPDPLPGLAKEIWETDLARIRRLEDKLTSQLSFLTPFVPIVTVLGGFALAKNDMIAFWVTVAAGLYLLAAFRMSSAGTAAVPLAVVVPLDIEEALDNDEPEATIAACHLANAGYNAARGIELNNHIVAGTRSLFWSVALIGLALAELARRFL